MPIVLAVILNTAEMIYIGAVELEEESLPNHLNLIVRQAEKALDWDHMKEQLYLNKEIIMSKSDDMMVSVEGKVNSQPRIGRRYIIILMDSYFQ
ncbi:hypothetical protein EI200_08770 [Peribacillus simplex]|uniref:hypothetical protein n=1 Tax=Peribacillus simplex TaxID=1478 RepID=UPI000F62F03C|nr:hypothetical protein [Peribacillus simplex]RRN72286.1 hypothetical protein EI200_08770 [Peribacillus simplex]